MRIALLDAFDIQRARDHGLPDYNTMRAAYGLPQVQSFAEISSDPIVQQALASVYANVNSIDPLVGALAEDHLAGASIGPLVAAAYRLQFDRLRDGDRFWYQSDSDLTAAEIATIDAARLSDIIRRNSGITNLQADVFFVPEPAIRGEQARITVAIACGLAALFGRRRSRGEGGRSAILGTRTECSSVAVFSAIRVLLASHPHNSRPIPSSFSAPPRLCVRPFQHLTWPQKAVDTVR
jgi:hypothetical protein